MKILITGGRGYSNKDKLFKVLDTLIRNTSDPEFEVIHGDAIGADAIAKEWAESRKLQYPHIIEHRYPIEKWEWTKYGKGAGPKRNQRMLDAHLDLDMVLAFPDPKSRGTYDMTERAAVVGIPTKIFKDKS